MTRKEAEETLTSVNYWHYPFDLPWGKMHADKPEHDLRHQKRWYHFFQLLLNYYGGSLREKTILDLGCCQGFWSFEAEKYEASHCHGIDSSQIFVSQAEALKTILGYTRCSFKCAHLENDPWYNDVGMVDTTLFLGLFYHLADPVFVFRKAMECTRETIIVDTEVIPSEEPVLTIVPRDPEEPTTCLSQLSTKTRLIPTSSALHALLIDGGFEDIHLLQSHPSMPGEYLTGHRLTIMAHRKEN